MKTVLDQISVNPAQAATEIMRCLNAGLVPFLKSQPAAGKSQIVRAIAEKLKLKLIDLRLSGYEPSDFSLPKLGEHKATFIPTDLIPVEGDEIPEGYKGWLLFLN